MEEINMKRNGTQANEYVNTLDYGKVAIRTNGKITDESIDFIELSGSGYAEIRKDKSGMLYAVIVDGAESVV